MEKLKLALVTLFSIIVSYYNNLYLPIIMLIICNILDTLTGIFKSLYIKKKFTCSKFFWGFIRKLCMYFLIFIGICIDIVIVYTVENLKLSIPYNNLFSGLICVWLILDELLSILRNLVVLEIPMPNFLISIIKKLKSTIDNS